MLRLRRPDLTQRRDIKMPRAFTLLEVLVTVVIIAIIATAVAPAFTNDNHLRLVAAVNVLSSDLELAQVMTISYPDSPVVVRFNPDKQMYWLAYASDPDNPITRAGTGEAYLTVMGQGRAASAQGVTLKLDDVANDTIEFNAQGGLVDFTGKPMIQLNRGDASITLSISPTTGTTTES